MHATRNRQRGQLYTDLLDSGLLLALINDENSNMKPSSRTSIIENVQVEPVKR